MNASESGKLYLVDRFSFAFEPCDQRQRDPLQMGEAVREQHPVHLALVACREPPQHKPGRAFGGAERIRLIPQGKELGAMLEAGEIDALISADNPKCILEQSPKVGRLFENYPSVEREYFQRTGIFPIMHTVVIRKDTLAANPGLAQTMYKAFSESKQAAIEDYKHGHIFNNMGTMVPWLSHLLEQGIATLGEDWWPYGIGANRKAVEAILRYHYEQGITDRLFKIEDIFVPELLNT